MALYVYAQNYLTTPSLIVPSSLSPMQHPPYIERYVAGSARMELRGTYTDTENRNYVIRISYADNVGFVYRYDWSDSGGTTWNAIDVLLVDNAWQALNHGLDVRFIAGAYSPQLVVGDRFRFHIERPYRPAFAIDGSRDNEMRSGPLASAATATVTFPFATNTTPAALVLHDHNLPASTTLRLQASTTSNFASTPYNQVVPWAADKILFRLASGMTFPYWRLHLTMGTTVSYVGWSGLYLGGELTFTREFDIGFRRTLSLVGGSDLSILARGPGRYGLQPQRYELTFERLGATDLATIHTWWDATHPTNRSQVPFYLYFDSVPELAIFEAFHLEGEVPETHGFLERMSPSLSLLQLVRTAA